MVKSWWLLETERRSRGIIRAMPAGESAVQVQVHSRDIGTRLSRCVKLRDVQYV